MQKVIRHRQRVGFKDHLHAFHSELAKWMEEVESGEAQADFIQSRGSTVSDFSDEVVSLGAGVAVFGLGVWHLLSKPPETMEQVKQIAEGAVFVVSSTIALRGAWKHTKSRRFTRKYMADLKRLQ